MAKSQSPLRNENKKKDPTISTEIINKNKVFFCVYFVLLFSYISFHLGSRFIEP